MFSLRSLLRFHRSLLPASQSRRAASRLCTVLLALLFAWTFAWTAAADTVGAGDSFSAAFVYSILTGKSVREAHKKAVEISAFVCTKEGAWPKYDF